MNTELRELILKLIEKNSRLAIHDLAVMLDVAETEVANEIADMEKEHIICGYHTLINWDNTSKDQLTAMIEVKVTPQRGQGFDRIAERIYNFPEVKAVYLMSGGYDFMVMLEGKTMKEISMFTSSKLAPLESVVSTVTHFVLKKYKDHGTITVTSVGVGTSNVTVTVAETANYLAGEATCKVTVDSGSITGSVKITGRNMYGETLTANTNDIAPTGCTFTYKWYINGNNSAPKSLHNVIALTIINSIVLVILYFI